jgi:hypothetical protein
MGLSGSGDPGGDDAGGAAGENSGAGGSGGTTGGRGGGNAGGSSGATGGGSAGQDCGAGANVTGTVSEQGAGPIPSARVTLLDDGDAFWEARTDASGLFSFQGIPDGSYELGAAVVGKQYAARDITVAGGCVEEAFELVPETEPGQWTSHGSPGEIFGGTNSGVLLPDGRLMYCHDTLDPVILNPVDLDKFLASSSGVLQGCHGVTLLHDGRSLYIGGADVPVYGPGSRQVKAFDPVLNRWTPQPQLNDQRWYPTVVPLQNGQVLAIGGGGPDNPARLNTTEVLDPDTMEWTPVGNISLGNEVSPVILLLTGEVLMTHRPPQLYNPDTQEWRLAGDFVQSNRMSNGDHSDHEMVLLPSGEVVAVGFMSFSSGNDGELLEIYDPIEDEWRLGATFAPVRSRASIVQLPNKKILVLGGFKEEERDPTPTNEWGQLALADLYDPTSDSWRRLAPMSLAREYHAMPILVPDGRVFITGGEGSPGEEPTANLVESFTPPYLLRGPRPVIFGLSTTDFERGQDFTFSVSKTNAITSVIMMGSVATTHFQDSGNGRFLELEFTQDADQVTARVPADPNLSVYGYYILFAMVDDIPSVGQMVRIGP